MDSALPIAVDDLLEHSSWMRALARQLVHDSAAADDVVQEALVAALRRKQGGEAAQRGWLARVVYNQAAMLARGERRRRAREERAARSEALPSSDELVARAELSKRVAEAVLELRDPYRSVLLLRYYEGLEPDEIARKRELPPSTVRNQLARGLAQLRERLDELHSGDRRAWSLALVPIAIEREALVVGAGASSTLIAGLIAMPLSLKLLVSGLIALVLWLALFWREPDEARPRVASAVPVEVQPSSTVRDSAEPTVTAQRSEVDEARAETRADAAVVVDSAANEPLPESIPDLDAREWLTFTVKNERGNPVADAEIVIKALGLPNKPGYIDIADGEGTGAGANGGGHARGRTGNDGTLRLSHPAWRDRNTPFRGVMFSVTHPAYVTFDSSRSVHGPEIDVVLLVGPTLIVSGWIEEPTKLVRGVRVHVSFDADVKLDDWRDLGDGRLLTTRFPAGAHSIYLECETADHVVYFSECVEFAIENRETKPLSLRLHPSRTLRGRLDPELPRPVGDGVVELSVSLGAGQIAERRYTTAIRADGSFEIAGLPIARVRILATCAGWVSKLDSPSDSSQPVAGEIAAAQSDRSRLSLDLSRGDGEIIVPMEPTATLVVTVDAPDGKALPGAEIATLAHGGAGEGRVWPQNRTWTAKADANGVARIEGLPAGWHRFYVLSAEYELPLERQPSDAESRERRESFRPGEIVRRVYTLERKSGD